MAMDAHKVSVHTPSGQDCSPYGVEPLHAEVFPQVCLPPTWSGAPLDFVAGPTCARPASQDGLPDGKKPAAATPPHRKGGKQAGGTKTYIHSYCDKMMAASTSLRNPEGPESTSEDAAAKQSTVAM